MPLTAIQQSVAEVLRIFRSKRSYVAGGAALNREWSRLSDDMDIFLDDRDRLPRSVVPELEALRSEGFAVELANDNDLVQSGLCRITPNPSGQRRVASFFPGPTQFGKRPSDPFRPRCCHWQERRPISKSRSTSMCLRT